jgi:hypothetical protein
MSSWIIAKNRQTKKNVGIKKYHDTSSTSDVFTMYLELIASYIYSQKMGEQCNIWDPSGLVKNTLRSNPQLKVLKEKPETEALTLSQYNSFVSPLTFKEVQRVASSLISYDQTLNQTVVKFLEKSNIKAMFDIGIHLLKDPAGPDLSLMKQYINLIKTFQQKAKKETLNIYVMSDNYSVVQHFQSYCDPSWKVISMSKTPLRVTDDAFIQAMAEVQIMTALPALILDFDRPVDKFIYLMQRNVKMQYFTEINNEEWKLL